MSNSIMNANMTTTNVQLFTLEEAQAFLKQKEQEDKQKEKQQKIDEQRVKAEARSLLCQEFNAKVLELKKLHDAIILNKMDYTEFLERIQEADPDNTGWGQWEQSWEQSSC